MEAEANAAARAGMPSAVATLAGAPAPAPTSPAPVTSPAAGARSPRLVSDEAVAAGRAHAHSGARRTPVFSPGVAPPPGTAEDTPLIARDASVSALSVWANTAMSSVWDEGLTFLGYPYLSELAQRPEYRMICETLATEATREWIEFQAEGDADSWAAEKYEPSTHQPDTLPSEQREAESRRLSEQRARRIKQIEEEFKRLDVQGAMRRVLTQDGFFGRGHLYVDTGATEQPDELLTSLGDGWGPASVLKMRGKTIVALRPVEAVWCYPTEYNSNDPLRGDWYRPSCWTVQAKRVHSTRLLTIISREVPDMLKPVYAFGGLSMSQMVKPYVDNWLKTRQSVNDIISSFSVFVLATNMQASLQGTGEDMWKRAELFNLVRDNRGLMMTDKETEEFQNVAVPLSGLDLLQAQSQEHMASVSHIPTVKLLGLQPAGLNADSEGVMRAFYDWVLSYQEAVLRAPIHTILGFVMLGLWGELDRTIGFRFRPLWSLDEKGEAEVQKIKADTDAVHIDSGVIDAAEARSRLIDDPDSGYDDLDPDDMPEPPAPDPADLMGGALPGQTGEADDEPVRRTGTDDGPAGGGKQPPQLRVVGGDSAYSRVTFDDGQWKEGDHPRDKDGKFSSGSGGGMVSVRREGSRWVAAEGGSLPEHVGRLRIPPAWRDVRVSSDPGAALQAVGRDAKGRRVSVYSEEHSMQAAARKYARVRELSEKFEGMRRENAAAQRDERTREAADCLALVMGTGVRPGSDTDTGAERQAFGATTLLGRHVVEEGGVTRLRFTGKKGVDLDLPVTDRALSRMLSERAARAGADGRLFNVSDSQLREYTAGLDGGGFRPKDFRTHLGTRTARELVAAREAPRDEKSYRRAVMDVAREVARRLGNTPVVALASYISPTVFADWRIA